MSITPNIAGRECWYGCGQPATVRIVADHRHGSVTRRVRYACDGHTERAVSTFPALSWDITISALPKPTVCDRCGRPVANVDGRWSDTESDTAILGSGQVCPEGGRDGLLHIVNGSTAADHG
ncbi:hypothetical protein J2S40_001154 [Nocardioides luteus]|uniref:Uncharacterized protein n=1 Tax=Nocardioides luteus TaxID=1844 RepID=A0ABQ5ST86_9ACTN|nr:hypothetical protein [Nocardioides luteus]GGR64811.1 hypothetical protein GCM10010197_35350 [Nocardioides luteus]GLJ66996.1 hypothetical protein GCM10017579_10320 [Nocardioides luteus]